MDRLDEEVRGPSLEARDPVVEVTGPRDDDHRQVAGRLVLAEPREDAQAAQAWHLDVQQHEVDRRGVDQSKSSFPIRRLDRRVPGTRQRPDEESASGRLVVHDQDPLRHLYA